MLKKQIGIEAEFLLLDKEGKAIVPPDTWDRDGFPLLGEIRGEPGDNVVGVIANFLKRKLLAEAKVKKSNQIVYSDIVKVPLATYKKALKQATEPKGDTIDKVKNIYGINIDDYSDQIVKNGKIQGIHASCGLHIHFSCADTCELKYTEDEYERVSIPLGMTVIGDAKMEDLMDATITPELVLYKKVGSDLKRHLIATADQLNRPAIEWIVKQMDEEFFEKFAPAKDKRTKYRQPGFYELKPHGFEYRSLPANEDTLRALPEIVGKAFKLLESLRKF